MRSPLQPDEPETRGQSSRPRRSGEPTKIPTELRYRIEVRLLRHRRQIADRHVLDHAAANGADPAENLLSQGGAGKNPGSSQQKDTRVTALECGATCCVPSLGSQQLSGCVE